MNLVTSALLTDLYQLTMLHAYFARGMVDTAVFEFFIRKLPANRNFMMAAGLEQTLEFLEGLRFEEEELEWVRRSGRFPPQFADHLAALRFTGDVHAMPEGTIFFPHEPVLRVVAPLPEGQIVETRLINLMLFQTLVATKAARGVLMAPGKQLVDFGLRRAHGAEAGLLASRAAYIAGYAGTATVLAGMQFGIPLFGTMAHSFIQAHDDETQAFIDFGREFPSSTVFLVDTYDTEAAVHKVAAIAPQLKREGIAIRGVRLDSGDLVVLSKRARRILDDAGLQQTIIFASGNIDEYQLQELMAAGAPIDGFGVGTSLVTSSDAPSFDAVYKLQEYAGRPRRKRSTGKATWPGRKQVFRHYDAQGCFAHDVVSLEDDVGDRPLRRGTDPALVVCPLGEALLVPVMKGGKRLGPAESLEAIRSRAAAQLAKLPPAIASLDKADAPYPVEIAPALRALAEEVDRANP